MKIDEIINEANRFQNFTNKLKNVGKRTLPYLKSIGRGVGKGVVDSVKGSANKQTDANQDDEFSPEQEVADAENKSLGSYQVADGQQLRVKWTDRMYAKDKYNKWFLATKENKWLPVDFTGSRELDNLTFAQVQSHDVVNQ